ncbi:MAG: hypothetical protein AAGF95_31385 [Chloroflexota bacterium]
MSKRFGYNVVTAGYYDLFNPPWSEIERQRIGFFHYRETCYGLLKEVGLQVRAAYQDFSFTPVSSTAEQVILEASWP